MEIIFQNSKFSKIFVFGLALKIICSFISTENFTILSPTSIEFSAYLTNVEQYINKQYSNDYFHIFLLNTLFFLADFTILICLMRLAPNFGQNILVLYWISPVVIIQVYLLNDLGILTISLLLLSFYFLKQNKIMQSALMVVLSIITNLAIVYLLPFIVIYFLQQKRIHEKLSTYFLTLFIFSISLGVVIYFFNEYKIINFSWNPILQGIANITYIPSADFTFMPLLTLYFLSLYLFWRLLRTSLSELISVMGAASLVFLLISGNIQLWFIVALPFLILYAVKTTLLGKRLVYFTQLLITFFLIYSSIPEINIAFISNEIINDVKITDLITNSITLILVILVMRIISEEIIYSSYHRVTRRPLVFGISGDSGSGKDTLSRALAGLFSNNSVSTIYGDAYHKWDRNAPMWKTVTHLNPLANNLSQLTKDVTSVTTGEMVYTRHYDHQEGRFTHPIKVKSNDVVFVTGLHSLFDSQLREKIDIKIFLETDSELRKHWKVNRDSNNRNQSKDNILNTDKLRDKDRNLYIIPQEKHSHITFKLMPVNTGHLNSNIKLSNIPLKLLVKVRHSIEYEALIRSLIGICGLHVDWEVLDEPNTIQVIVEGDVSPEDIKLSSLNLFNFHEILSLKPKWEANMIGVMQLFVISYVQQKLAQRIKE